MVLDQFQRRGGVQGPGHDARDPQAATARGRGPERRGQEALDWAAEARAVHGAAAEFLRLGRFFRGRCLDIFEEDLMEKI